MSRKKRKNKSPGPQPARSHAQGPAAMRRELVAARLLLGICAAIAAYLAYASFANGPIAGCGPESACNKVLQSRWAYTFGLPVSVPSLAVYLGLLIATFNLGGRGPEDKAGRWRGWAVALSLTVIAAATWFVLLQAIAIKSFCRFCMVAHGGGVVASILVLLAVRNAAAAVRPTPIPLSRALLVAAGAMALLISGQVFFERARYQVQTTPSQTAIPGTTQQRRTLSLHQGQFQLALDELPIIGDPTAPKVMLSLFDYTCHYCRELHGLLVQAQRRHSNEVAIINLPMPLDAACNRLMTRTPGAHQNACEYARVGLAVWRAKSERSAEFDDWVFAPPSPLPVADVRRHAEELVGKENLERALADPWIERQLQTSISIYEANYRQMRSGSMPQLVVGDAISVGPLDNLQQLETLLRQHLGVGNTPTR